jgi:hypothetical protein
MRTLGGGTDGLAVFDTNDLDRGLRRIADDLTSYYLLGYYSTNPRTDGGYRSLRVRVARPGVAVRARRGYRAASPEEVARSRAGISGSGRRHCQLRAVRTGRARRDPSRRAGPAACHVVAGQRPVLDRRRGSPDRARTNEWAQGGTADLQITTGAASASSRVAIEPGDRSFLTSVRLPGATSEIEVQARVSSPDGEPATATLRVAATPQPLFYRRGPATANRQVATADARFTRADRVHLELPAART